MKQAIGPNLWDSVSAINKKYENHKKDKMIFCFTIRTTFWVSFINKWKVEKAARSNKAK